MTGSSPQRFRAVLHPLSDLVKAKRIDESYYVGFEAQGRLIAAGATVKQPAHDVGGGRLLATVTRPNGNALGLLQVR
ncbi:hypothetical protein FE633_14830 [Streptomyces montanus]|uniref:Uncharacterized protein n=1 Tax=Streptomyces montanus TaxID=2580423 RepID=A0A5R9FWW3_9ACTN|nr:hypothetical protein [Streptomyces montanus]TLS45353.1 hypothetical protein FE633_14830 [Streptomyces montanus]